MDYSTDGNTEEFEFETDYVVPLGVTDSGGNTELVDVEVHPLRLRTRLKFRWWRFRRWLRRLR